MLVCVWATPSPSAPPLLSARLFPCPPPPPATAQLAASVPPASRSLPLASPLAKHCSWLSARAPLAAQLLPPASTILLTDTAGNLLESLTANVLLLRGSRLLTPPPAGVLPGYARSLFLALAGEAGLKAAEEPIRAGGLGGGDRLFLTSSVALAQEVVRVVDGGGGVLWERGGEPPPGKFEELLGRVRGRCEGEEGTVVEL